MPGTGHTPSRERPELWIEDECVIPWFTLADVWQIREGNAAVVTETAARVSAAGVAASSAVVHPAGTVLLSRTASVGFSAVMGVDMAVSQDYMTWTPGPRLHGRFLLYVLRGLRQEFGRLMSGSTHKTIYMPDLLGLGTPLPPVERQVEIAGFLDRECCRIAGLEEEIVEHDRHLSDPALETFRRLTQDMPSGRVGYRFEVQLGKMLDEKRVDPENVSPYLRNANVQWDRLDLGDLKRMTFSPAEKRKFSLQPGDLLVCEGGEPGRAAVWNGEVEDCYFQKALHRVRPFTDDSVRFLLWCLRDLSQRGAFKSDGPGRYTHLTAEQLRGVRIPMPSARTQKPVAADVDAEAAAGRAISHELDGFARILKEYREALITESVTGRLDVSRVSERRAEESALAAVEGVRPELLSA